MKTTLVTVLALLLSTPYLYAQTESQEALNSKKRTESLVLVKEQPYNVYDVAFVQNKDWTELYKIPNHPAFDSLLTPEVEQNILAEINQRRRELKSDTLLTADFFYVWKPYFDWLRNEDPHYRLYPLLSSPAEEKKQLSENIRNQKRLPFTTYTINDSVIVHHSFDSNFKKGDLLLAINNTTMSEYLKYYYSDRYSSINNCLMYYYFGIATKDFEVKLVRNEEEITVTTEGLPNSELFKFTAGEEYNTKLYADAKCGYIQIKTFQHDNSTIVKVVDSAIKDFKKSGVSNVIIDVRRNTGGNGDEFVELLSIFIDKPSIKYMNGQKLRVSTGTLGDYDFLREDMIGKNISIPDEHLIKIIPLDNKLYIGGMNYYVLASENTGSIAASFVNILQYNDAATIVGEPLLRNALKYGEILNGDTLYYTNLIELGVSTTEMDEYTKAVDGLLVPDIHIPYVASEYMTGKDAVLEKLLKIIKTKE